MPKKSTFEQFIIKARKVHGDTYYYNLSVYINNKTNMDIICSTHGIFQQNPNKHTDAKTKCPECSLDKKRITKEEWIRRSNIVHNYKYLYTISNFINYDSIVNIICTKHGIFSQTANNHDNNKQGCKKCDIIRRSLTTEQFIIKARKVHGDTYDYPDEYINAYTKMNIVCKIHGIFRQTPKDHTNRGCSCPRCKSSISKSETKWLDSLNVPNILSKSRQVTLIINSINIRVDGYNKETNTIYEFWGDFWHGNPKIFNPNDINPRTYKTYGTLYEETLQRRQLILDAGYNLVEIWENDWKVYLKNMKILK